MMQRRNWHNLPPNNGLARGYVFNDLTPAQRDLGMTMVKAVLSPYGYRKITDITAADEFLGTEMGVARRLGSHE